MLTHPLLQGRSRGNDAVHEDSGATDGQSGCTCGFWIPDSWAGAGKWGGVEDHRGTRPGTQRGRHAAVESHPLAEDKKNSTRLGACLIFIDESGLKLTPIVRRKWTPVGCTPLIRHHRRTSGTLAWEIEPAWVELVITVLKQTRRSSRRVCSFERASAAD